MKSKLKVPGTERLILKYDNLLSGCTVNFNLRRCSQVAERSALELAETRIEAALICAEDINTRADLTTVAGADTGPLLSLI